MSHNRLKLKVGRLLNFEDTSQSVLEIFLTCFVFKRDQAALSHLLTVEMNFDL